MKRPVIVILAATVAVAQAGPASAGPADSGKQVFLDGIEPQIAELRHHFDANRRAQIAARPPDQFEPSPAKQRIADQVDRAAADQYAGARATPLEADNTAAVVRTASLAIRTDVDGAEAGIAVAPLVLAGLDSRAARAWNVTAASLAESKFRVATSYRFELGGLGLGPEALGYQGCVFQAADYREQLVEAATHYGELCAVLWSGSDPGPAGGSADDQADWANRAGLCGVQLPAGVSDAQRARVEHVRAGTLLSKIAGLQSVVKRVQNTPHDQRSAALKRLAEPGDAIDVLAKLLDVPSITSCVDDAALPGNVRRARWRLHDLAIGVSTHADFFPRQFGFNPDTSVPQKTLPSGELAETELRGELQYTHARWTVTGGLGGKLARDTFEDPLGKSVRASAGIAALALRLDGKPVEDEDGNVILTKDDKLSPVMSIGLDAAIGFAIDRPVSQHSVIDDVSVSLFVDFKVSDTLAFRLGIPLQATTVTREADDSAIPKVTERRALQWTVPVFVTTVLKM